MINGNNWSRKGGSMVFTPTPTVIFGGSDITGSAIIAASSQGLTSGGVSLTYGIVYPFAFPNNAIPVCVINSINPFQQFIMELLGTSNTGFNLVVTTPAGAALAAGVTFIVDYVAVGF